MEYPTAFETTRWSNKNLSFEEFYQGATDAEVPIVMRCTLPYRNRPIHLLLFDNSGRVPKGTRHLLMCMRPATPEEVQAHSTYRELEAPVGYTLYLIHTD